MQRNKKIVYSLLIILIFSTIVGCGGPNKKGGGGGPQYLISDVTSDTTLFPELIAVDASNTVYVSSPTHHIIYKITSSSTVRIGTIDDPDYQDGSRSTAKFNYPWGVALDTSNKLFIGDRNNHVIRTYNSSDDSVELNSGIPETSGSSNSAPVSYNSPRGIALDSSNNVYIADYGNLRIRKIRATSGVVSTLPPNVAADDLAVDSAGNIYAVSSTIHQVFKYDSTGALLATYGDGTPGIANSPDPRFNGPHGIGIDSEGNIYVADTGNHTIRKITSTGTVSTFAGKAGESGYLNGKLADARFNSPTDVAVSSSGTIYIADRNNNKVKKITH